MSSDPPQAAPDSSDEESPDDRDETLPRHGASSEDDEPDEGDLEGSVISERYRLDEFIGGGGMGEVYRAEHVMMKKTVAVKILRSEVTDRERLVERFRREAQAAGNLDHPNVCSATDFGRAEDGSFYLVMEYVEGKNLGDILARHGALEVERALEIADQIADALEIAHENGVVHRDLKPENVMLVTGADGTESVKVLDFGVSRVQMAEDMPSITQTGAVFGTPHYMSPEQAGGEEVDRRADLYGLGSVLYEMLTGRPVFEGEKSVHVMAAHLKDEPDAPSATADWIDVPDELDQLVLDLLEKDPDDRPQSATDVRGRIELVRQQLFGSSNASEAGADQEAALEAPSSSLLERAGETTRTFYRVVDRRLPLNLDVDRISASKLAVASLFALAIVLFGAVVTIYTAQLLLSRAAPDAVYEDILAERRAFQEHEKVGTAVATFREGSPGEAAETLATLEETYPSNPHLQFLIGQTRAAADDWETALTHYQRALRARPNYTADPALLGDLVYALGSGDEQVREPARKLLQTHIRNREVRERLARTAWHAESDRLRNRARELLAGAEFLEKLPTWEQRAIALRRAEGCKQHRERIQALAKTGAPEAVQVLRIYDQKPRSGCGSFDKQDCYGCVRDDIEKALERLRGGSTRRGDS